jgi:hypothetical protein
MILSDLLFLFILKRTRNIQLSLFIFLLLESIIVFIAVRFLFGWDFIFAKENEVFVLLSMVFFSFTVGTFNHFYFSYSKIKKMIATYPRVKKNNFLIAVI